MTIIHSKPQPIFDSISWMNTDEIRLYNVAREIVADIMNGTGMTFALVAERFEVLYQTDLNEYLLKGLDGSEYNHFMAIIEGKIKDDYWTKAKEYAGIE